MPSSFAYQIFWVVSTQLKHSSNSPSIYYQISLCCKLSICDSITEWSKAQRISAPSLRTLQIQVVAYQSLNHFGPVIYTSQKSTKNISPSFWESSRLLITSSFLTRCLRILASVVQPQCQKYGENIHSTSDCRSSVRMVRQRSHRTGTELVGL